MWVLKKEGGHFSYESHSTALLIPSPGGSELHSIQFGFPHFLSVEEDAADLHEGVLLLTFGAGPWKKISPPRMMT